MPFLKNAVQISFKKQLNNLISSRVKYFGSANFKSVFAFFKRIVKSAYGAAHFKETDYTFSYNQF